MAETLTPEHLREMLAVAERATPGGRDKTWALGCKDDECGWDVRVQGGSTPTIVASFCSEADAAHIATFDPPTAKALVIALLSAHECEERLTADLKAAVGYLTNARVDLESGAPKKTAILTIGGGIARARAALTEGEVP